MATDEPFDSATPDNARRPSLQIPPLPDIHAAALSFWTAHTVEQRGGFSRLVGIHKFPERRKVDQALKRYTRACGVYNDLATRHNSMAAQYLLSHALGSTASSTQVDFSRNAQMLLIAHQAADKAFQAVPPAFAQWQQKWAPAGFLLEAQIASTVNPALATQREALARAGKRLSQVAGFIRALDNPRRPSKRSSQTEVASPVASPTAHAQRRSDVPENSLHAPRRRPSIDPGSSTPGSPTSTPSRSTSRGSGTSTTPLVRTPAQRKGSQHRSPSTEPVQRGKLRLWRR